MTYALLSLIISLLLFLLFTETVTLRYIYDGAGVIRIDFMLFGISISAGKNGRKRKRRGKKSKRVKIKDGIKKSAEGAVLFSRLPTFLARAEIDINGISVMLKPDEPHKQALTRAAFYSSLSSAIAYFESYAKNFSYNDIIIGVSDNNKTVIRADISATTTLLNLAVSFISYLFSRKPKK